VAGMSCELSINTTDENVIVQAVFDRITADEEIDKVLSADGKAPSELERSRIYAHQTLCYLLVQLSLIRGGDLDEQIRYIAKSVMETCLASTAGLKQDAPKIVVPESSIIIGA